MIIIKNKEQIIGIRKSCQLAALTLKHIESFVAPGVTTLFLNDEIEKFIRANGAIPAPLNYHGYPKACCISANNIICHGIPNSYCLEEGDILNIDVTTILDGYYGDTSTMFQVGKISDEAKYLIDVTKGCLDIGIAQVREGNRFGNIGYHINEFAIEKNCTVVTQFCAHGLGLFFHEEPTICHVANRDSGPRMKAGMIFTVEPMICLKSSEVNIMEDGWTAVTIDGGLSAQYEETILVKSRDEFEILTQC